MQEWDLSRSSDRAARLRLLATNARSIAKRSNREAVNFLLQAIGVRATITRDESYYDHELNYSLALAYAYLDEPETAVDFLGRSGVLPFDGGDLLFSEAQRRGLGLANMQEASLARQVPCVFLASMPRAASAALASTIAQVFGCPILRASLGRFPNWYLVPSWVRRISRGGCVLHDHFGAEQFNQRILSDCGIRTVFVLIRDPRAASVSAAMLDQKFNGTAVSEEHVLHIFESMYLPWLINWEEYAAGMNNVNVVWLRSMDVTAGDEPLRATINQIIASLAPSAPSWQAPDLSTLSLANANFESGTSDGWRKLVSKSGQERMWSKLPVRFREMLELTE